MVGSDDFWKFFERAHNTNQVVLAAVAVHETGILTGDQRLVADARKMVSDIIRRQTRDGVFPERGGFDSTYQLISVETLARYSTTVTDPRWRSTVLGAVRKGLDRYLEAVTPTGEIKSAGNSRTISCGPEVRGAGAKGKRVDIGPLRLYYVGMVLGADPGLDDVARRIQQSGQVFTHAVKCTPRRAGRLAR
jgi:hypothetical protein